MYLNQIKDLILFYLRKYLIISIKKLLYKLIVDKFIKIDF